MKKKCNIWADCFFAVFGAMTMEIMEKFAHELEYEILHHEATYRDSVVVLKRKNKSV